MPQELTDFRGIDVGDVLMIKQEFQSKEMRQAGTAPREWRWFGLVEKAVRQGALCHRLGAKDGAKPWAVFMDSVISVHLLHPDEWPDGVHALRAKLILLGVIDI